MGEPREMCVNLSWFTMTLDVGSRQLRRRGGSRVMGKTARAHKTSMYGTPTNGTYKELDLVTIPEPIPELGIEAGFLGTVDLVYKGGRKADVAVSNTEGITFGYVTVSADPEPHVVAYYIVEDD